MLGKITTALKTMHFEKVHVSGHQKARDTPREFRKLAQFPEGPTTEPQSHEQPIQRELLLDGDKEIQMGIHTRTGDSGRKQMLFPF